MAEAKDAFVVSLNCKATISQADKRHLFPNWVKPSDAEPPPLLVYKWCQVGSAHTSRLRGKTVPS